MDQTKANELKEQLLKEQQRLQEDIERSDRSRVENLRPPGDSSNVPTHAADHDAEGIDRQLIVDETLREELRQVNEALDRARDGNFGKCTRCGNEIAVERLEAIPHTPFCIECERAEEREEAGTR